MIFLTRPFGFGGTEKHLVDVIQRLDPTASEVAVVVTGLDPYTERLGKANLKRVRVVPGPRGGKFLRWWLFLRSLRPRIVVFVNGDFPLFSWRMYLAARFSGARRVVAIEHSIANPPAYASLRSALRVPRRKWRALREWLTGPVRRAVTMRLPGLVSDATICVSDPVRERLIREYHYPAAKTITRRNGVDLSFFARNAADWGAPRDLLAGKGKGPVAVCVALLVPCKRVDVLIHAMTRVVTRYPESCCVIVGGGVLEQELRSMVGELGIEKNVLFVGWRDDVRPYLAAGDVFVSASEREGFGLALVEAMAFGLPCVAADAGGNRDVIREGVNAFLVPAGSADALADAIARLFGDPEERARMGKNARRIAEEEFDIEKSMAGVKAAILGGA